VIVGPGVSDFNSVDGPAAEGVECDFGGFFLDDFFLAAFFLAASSVPFHPPA